MKHANSLAELNDRILSERAARFSQAENTESTSSGEEMIIFQLDRTSYAIPLRMLTELRSLQKITPLPKVSQTIVGVINVRGRIVSVYRLANDGSDPARQDAAVADAFAAKSSNSRGFVLIGHGDASSVALLADDITGTRIVEPGDIRAKPISLNERDYIIGLGSDGLVYLDIDKFVTSTRHYLA